MNEIKNFFKTKKIKIKKSHKNERFSCTNLYDRDAEYKVLVDI